MISLTFTTFSNGAEIEGGSAKVLVNPYNIMLIEPRQNAQQVMNGSCVYFRDHNRVSERSSSRGRGKLTSYFTTSEVYNKVLETPKEILEKISEYEESLTSMFVELTLRECFLNGFGLNGEIKYVDPKIYVFQDAINRIEPRRTGDEEFSLILFSGPGGCYTKVQETTEEILKKINI